MSFHSFLRPGAAPMPPKRITIRRRLLGRGSRLPAVGMAAGLLSLGLASVQPAHAGTATWHGPTAVTDWYSQPSFWTGGSLISSGFDYPGSGDDAVNSAFNAPMTLGARCHRQQLLQQQRLHPLQRRHLQRLPGQCGQHCSR